LYGEGDEEKQLFHCAKIIDELYRNQIQGFPKNIPKFLMKRQNLSGMVFKSIG
jgi:hypothetical protein